MSKGNVPGVIGTGLRQFSGILNITDVGGSGLLTVSDGLIQVGNPSTISQVTVTAPTVFLNGVVEGLGPITGLPANMNPDSGSFPTTTIGFTTTTGPTINWYKIGQMVMLTIPDFDQTSNSTGFSFVGLPAGLVPSRNIIIPVAAATNNAFISTAFLYIRSATSGLNGHIEVYTGINFSIWNSSPVDKGLGWSFGDVTRAQCFTYQLI